MPSTDPMAGPFLMHGIASEDLQKDPNIVLAVVLKQAQGLRRISDTVVIACPAGTAGETIARIAPLLDATTTNGAA